MKKILLISIFASLFIFTGCFGGGNEPVGPAVIDGFSVYNATTFEISLPDDWDILEAKDFDPSVPSQTQVIFINNVKNDIFTANVNVSKNLLKEPISTYNFAKTEIINNKNTLLNYKEVSRDEEFGVIVGGEVVQSIFILFEGKQSEQQPTLRFLQAFAVNGADTYTITAAYLRNSDEILVDDLKNIIKTFKVR